ncbi:MAG TPA: TIGR00153 family protein [Sphingobacteriaceae bacterium]|nr:TIGR00153 family protein [Sphingobacteriaceae bacterium]
MPNIFKWLGTRQQQELLGLIPQHMDKVTRVVNTLAQGIAAFIAGDWERVREIQDQVSQIEREADRLRKDLLRRLSEGLFMPTDRSELVQLVERMDTVADHANAAARLLVLFNKPAKPALAPHLQRISDLLVEAVTHLSDALEALSAGKGREALISCDAVEAAEEEVDRVKHTLLRHLYDADLPPQELLLAHDLIEALENTADRAEDSADLVRVLAVKIP